MDVLVVLAAARGETLTKNELLASVWPGTVVVEAAIYRAIGELRQAFDDDARHQHMIENVPKRGYRLVAAVESSATAPPVATSSEATAAPLAAPETLAATAAAPAHLRRWLIVASAAAGVALLVIALISHYLPQNARKLAGTPVPAQVTSVPVSAPMRFERFGLDEGLAQLAVHAIAEDAAGVLWIGTEEGLNRYDGQSFQHWRHDPANTGSLANDYVANIQVDASGTLWLATDGGGVARRNPQTGIFSPIVTSHSADLDRVRAMRFDGAGRLWMATRDTGLAVFDPRSQSSLRFRHVAGDSRSLSHDSVYSILMDRRGAIWVGTETGVDRFDAHAQNMERVYSAAAGTSLIAKALLEDHEGAIWVACVTGLMRIDPSTGRAQWFRHDAANPRSLPKGQVHALMEDRRGQLWVGTDDGLARFDRKRAVLEVYEHNAKDPASLPDNSVISLHEDRVGRVWVGTQFGGLALWSQGRWTFGHHAGANVMALTEDHLSRLWLASYDGLSVIDPRSNSQTVGGLSDTRVMSLLTDHAGTIWAGTMRGGLNRIDPTRFDVVVYSHDPNNPHSLGALGVMSMLEDSGQRLWIGTFGGGLSRYDPKTNTFIRYTPNPADPRTLANGRVTVLAEDHHGRIWAGTDGGGLHILDPASGHFFRLPHGTKTSDSLRAATVYSLHVDHEGTVWVGTRSGGLDRVIGSSLEPLAIRFRNYSERDGLPNNTIYGIRGDKTGRLWLSTNRGLARFDPRTGEVLAFHKEHGLQGEEFNYGAHYTTAAGELIFGGPNGYNRFEP